MAATLRRSSAAPPVYNQAIRDARGFVEEELADFEGGVQEPDEPVS